MILAQEQYVSRIAERTADARQLLAQDLKQRRDQVVDIQGVEYHRSLAMEPGTPIPIGRVPITVSPDLIYWERFAFKITTYAASQGVDGFKIFLEGVDISPYLAAQYDSWIDHEGIFPTDKVEKDYDILLAASMMKLDGRADLADRILKPGYKLVSIAATYPMQVILTLAHVKYSHMNR